MLEIAIQEYGNPRGREIVLIHGLLASHPIWLKQVGDPRDAGHASFFDQAERFDRELDAVVRSTDVPPR